jgi:hypothetical protein
VAGPAAKLVGAIIVLVLLVAASYYVVKVWQPWAPENSRAAAPLVGPGLFANATLYNGSVPTPEESNFSWNGSAVTTEIIPGELVIFTPPSASNQTIEAKIRENGGSVLTAVPLAGLYVAGVAGPNEGGFVSAIEGSNSSIQVVPNLVLTSDGTAPSPGSGTSSSSAACPDPDLTRVESTPVKYVEQSVVAQLFNLFGEGNSSYQPIAVAVVDDFSSADSHGCEVVSVLRGDAAAQVEDSEDHIISLSSSMLAIRAVMLAAQDLQDKVIINFSSSANCGAACEGPAWLSFESIFLQRLNASASAWLHDGNVLITQALGNNNMDLNAVMYDLANDPQTGPTLLNNLLLVGETAGFGSNERWQESATMGSNYGGNALFFPDSSPPGEEGTSFSAPATIPTIQETWSCCQAPGYRVQLTSGELLRVLAFEAPGAESDGSSSDGWPHGIESGLLPLPFLGARSSTGPLPPDQFGIWSGEFSRSGVENFTIGSPLQFINNSTGVYTPSVVCPSPSGVVDCKLPGYPPVPDMTDMRFNGSMTLWASPQTGGGVSFDTVFNLSGSGTATVVWAVPNGDTGSAVYCASDVIATADVSPSAPNLAVAFEAGVEVNTEGWPIHLSGAPSGTGTSALSASFSASFPPFSVSGPIIDFAPSVNSVCPSPGGSYIFNIAWSGEVDGAGVDGSLVFDPARTVPIGPAVSFQLTEVG